MKMYEGVKQNKESRVNMDLTKWNIRILLNIRSIGQEIQTVY
jgi:hypothetical protein